MMRSKSYCKKCRKTLKVYVTCYECHAIYHPKCLASLTGFFVNEQGFMFCCGDVQEEKPIVQSHPLLENINIEENETSDSCNFIHIFDSKVAMGVAGRAKKTIPKNVLKVKQLSFGESVFALRNIPEAVYFGPYEGLKTVKHPNGFYVWRIRSGKLIDINTEEQSNWLRYVNCTDDVNIRNLTAFQYKKKMYYKTVKEIYAGEELLVSFQNGPKSFEVNVIEYFCPDNQELNKNMYHCLSCSYGFSNEKLLVTHKKVCPYNKNAENKDSTTKLTNKACKAEFSNAKLYAKHKTVCKKYFPSNEDKAHTSDLSNTEEKNWCPICKKSFKRKLDLIKHKKIHQATTKDFLCSYCDKSYFHKRSLIAHVNDVHTEDKTHKCSHCGFVTSKVSSLKRHMLSDHDVRIKKFKCNICPYASSSKRWLSYHASEHSNKTELTNLSDSKDNVQGLNESRQEEKLTEENDSAIKDQSDLKEQRTKEKKKEYVCPHCKKVYHSQSSRNFHIDTKHLNKTFKCSHCSFVTPYRKNLKKHTLAYHSTEQDVLKCLHCDYTTNIKEWLQKHMYTHMTDKPYKCQYKKCSFQTCTGFSLKEHVMSAHTFEKPFQCDTCGSKFVKKSNLKQHIDRKHR